MYQTSFFLRAGGGGEREREREREKEREREREGGCSIIVKIKYCGCLTPFV